MHKKFKDKFQKKKSTSFIGYFIPKNFCCKFLLLLILCLTASFKILTILGNKFNEYGEYELQQGNKQVAISYFSFAVKCNFIEPRYYFNRARAYYNFYNAVQAEEDIDQALYYFNNNYLEFLNWKQYYEKIEFFVVILIYGPKEGASKLTPKVEKTILDEQLFKDINKFKEEIKDTSVILQRISRQVPKDQMKNNQEKDQDSLDVHLEKVPNYLSDKTEIKEFAKNFRGVVALEDIEPNEPIVVMPIQEIVTDYDIVSNNIAKKIIKRTQVSNHNYFAIFYLLEKENPNSKFKLAFKYIPDSYESHPGNFKEKQLNMLEGSLIKQSIIQMQNGFKWTYETICNVAPEFKRFTYEQYVHAVLSQKTRLFQMIVNGHYVQMLVPLADMVNHYYDENTSYYFDDEKKVFVLKSIKPIKKGEELYNIYGRYLDNIDLFLDYGFITPNLTNVALIKISLKEEDAFLIDKRKLLLEQIDTFNTIMFRLYQKWTEDSSWSIISYLRLSEANTQQEMDKLTKMFSNFNEQQLKQNIGNRRFQFISFISIENELNMLYSLKLICETQLKAFTTTSEEDEKLLADKEQIKDYSYIERAIIQLISKEKQALQYFVNFADAMPLLYEMTLQEIQKELKTPKYNIYGEYIQQVIIPMKYQKSTLTNQ